VISCSTVDIEFYQCAMRERDPSQCLACPGAGGSVRCGCSV